jgi:hypothetical protein
MSITTVIPPELPGVWQQSDYWFKSNEGRRCLSSPNCFEYQLEASGEVTKEQEIIISVKGFLKYDYNTLPNGRGQSAACTVNLVRQVLLSSDGTKNTISQKLGLDIAEIPTKAADSSVSYDDAGANAGNIPHFLNDIVFAYADNGRSISVDVTIRIGVADAAPADSGDGCMIVVNLGQFQVMY